MPEEFGAEFEAKIRVRGRKVTPLVKLKILEEIYVSKLRPTIVAAMNRVSVGVVHQLKRQVKAGADPVKIAISSLDHEKELKQTIGDVLQVFRGDRKVISDALMIFRPV